MSSIRCKLGIHNWNLFGPLVNTYSENAQFRSCKRCNQIDFRSCHGNQVRPDVANNSIPQTPVFDTTK